VQTARTVVDQAHLCPLPLTAQPVYWELDHALQLQPCPDTLIIAEEQDPYTTEYNGCMVANPGNFAADTAFLVYRPAQRKAEISYVDEAKAAP
jgi:DNA polymerase epsilon subunit 2